MFKKILTLILLLSSAAIAQADPPLSKASDAQILAWTLGADQAKLGRLYGAFGRHLNTADVVADSIFSAPDSLLLRVEITTTPRDATASEVMEYLKKTAEAVVVNYEVKAQADSLQAVTDSIMLANKPTF